MATFREVMVDDLGSARRKISRIESKLDDLNGGPAPRDRDLADCRDLTNRLESTFNSLEMTVPAPMATDSYQSYRADALSRLQNFVADKNLSGVDLHKMARLDDNGRVMDHLEKEIVSAAKAVAADPNQGSFRNPGRLREVVEVDNAGRRWTTFKGPPSEWMQAFQYPSRRAVVAIRNPRTGQKLA